MIRQALGEESMSRAQKAQTHWDRKKARQVNCKVKGMLIIFLDIKGIVHKEFVLAEALGMVHKCGRRLLQG
jgi:hypothetical protein